VIDGTVSGAGIIAGLMHEVRDLLNALTAGRKFQGRCSGRGTKIKTQICDEERAHARFNFSLTYIYVNYHNILIIRDKYDFIICPRDASTSMT
jgi:hypothetical protein